MKYTPIVYNQISATSAQRASGTNFILEYKHTSLPEDGLLFFVPIYSCKNNATLTIRVPKLNGSTLVYEDTTFDIEVETNKGVTRRTQQNDIVAHRMCIFRFRKNNNNVILINSPLYNEANYTSLTATNATFQNKPLVYDSANDTYYTLVNSKEFEDLKQRVSKVENKIIYGNIDPEEALSDREAGTIYIKVEE